MRVISILAGLLCGVTLLGVLIMAGRRVSTVKDDSTAATIAVAVHGSPATPFLRTSMGRITFGIPVAELAYVGPFAGSPAGLELSFADAGLKLVLCVPRSMPDKSHLARCRAKHLPPALTHDEATFRAYVCTAQAEAQCLDRDGEEELAAFRKLLCAQSVEHVELLLSSCVKGVVQYVKQKKGVGLTFQYYSLDESTMGDVFGEAATPEGKQLFRRIAESIVVDEQASRGDEDDAALVEKAVAHMRGHKVGSQLDE